MSDYAIRGNDLGVSKAFIKERKEHMHHLLNLVKSDTDRIIEHTEKGWWITGNMMELDSLSYFAKSILEEIEQNYSTTRKEKCSYCKEQFVGIFAHDKRLDHEHDAHPEEWNRNFNKTMLFAGAMMQSMMNCLQISNAEDLYKKTGSTNAKQVYKLSKRGEDIPADLLKAYYRDSDDYYDSVDPKRRWHKPSNLSHLDKVEVVAGTKTIFKEITKAICKLSKGNAGDNHND